MYPQTPTNVANAAIKKSSNHCHTAHLLFQLPLGPGRMPRWLTTEQEIKEDVVDCQVPDRQPLRHTGRLRTHLTADVRCRSEEVLDRRVACPPCRIRPTTARRTWSGPGAPRGRSAKVGCYCVRRRRLRWSTRPAGAGARREPPARNHHTYGGNAIHALIGRYLSGGRVARAGTHGRFVPPGHRAWSGTSWQPRTARPCRR